MPDFKTIHVITYYPSVGRSVRRSVGRSVRPSFTLTWEHNKPSIHRWTQNTPQSAEEQKPVLSRFDDESCTPASVLVPPGCVNQQDSSSECLINKNLPIWQALPFTNDLLIIYLYINTMADATNMEMITRDNSVDEMMKYVKNISSPEYNNSDVNGSESDRCRKNCVWQWLNPADPPNKLYAV